MSEDDRYVENLRGALAQAIGIGERLQARIDAALAILNDAQSDYPREALLAALEGR